MPAPKFRHRPPTSLPRMRRKDSQTRLRNLCWAGAPRMREGSGSCRGARARGSKMWFLLHLRRVPWIVVLAVALFGAAAPPVVAQQPDDLEKQLQQLKQQYDATTHDLEQRIAALEQQIQKQKEASEKANEKEKEKEGTVTTVELAAEQAAQKVVLGQSD